MEGSDEIQMMLTMQRLPTSQAQNQLIQPHPDRYPLPVTVPPVFVL
jgi:hypothetical protein